MYSLIRKILFLFDAELIHEFSVKLIKLLSKLPFSKFLLRYFFLVNNQSLERNLFGLRFKNPVGLAAGFDKNAECYNEFSNFGFGFMEIGTVTPLPQPGNPKKRVFRLIEDKSLINRLGFNNKGLEVIKRNLTKKRDVIIGANIGSDVTQNTVIIKEFKIDIDDYDTNKLWTMNHMYVVAFVRLDNDDIETATMAELIP